MPTWFAGRSAVPCRVGVIIGRDWNNAGMSGADSQIQTFARLLDAWNGDDPDVVLKLITSDYAGHMLHLEDGERTGPMYPMWINRFRDANPGARFTVEDQGSAGDRLWTRVVAHRADGAHANGINESRFVGSRIAEEWAIWSAWHVA